MTVHSSRHTVDTLKEERLNKRPGQVISVLWVRFHIIKWECRESDRWSLQLTVSPNILFLQSIFKIDFLIERYIYIKYKCTSSIWNYHKVKSHLSLHLDQETEHYQHSFHKLSLSLLCTTTPTFPKEATGLTIP